MVSIFDFQHAVGRNGEAVPIPPEWNLSFAATVKAILVAAATLAGVMLLPAILPIVRQLGETPPLILGQRILLGIAIAAMSGLSAVALAILIAACWWPWSRRTLGASLEDQVKELTLEKFNEKIAACELGWRQAAEQRRDGYLRRLVWLERQRERLHGVPAPVR